MEVTTLASRTDVRIGISGDTLLAAVDRVEPCEFVTYARTRITTNEIRTAPDNGTQFGISIASLGFGAVVLNRAQGRVLPITAMVAGGIGMLTSSYRALSATDRHKSTRYERVESGRRQAECRRAPFKGAPIVGRLGRASFSLGDTGRSGRRAISLRSVLHVAEQTLCKGEWTLEVESGGSRQSVSLSRAAEDYFEAQYEAVRLDGSLGALAYIPARCPLSPYAREAATAGAIKALMNREKMLSWRDLNDILTAFSPQILADRTVAELIATLMEPYPPQAGEFPLAAHAYAAAKEAGLADFSEKIREAARKSRARELQYLQEVQKELKLLAYLLEEASDHSIRAHYHYCTVRNGKIVVSASYSQKAGAFGILAAYASGGLFDARATESELFENARVRLGEVGEFPTFLMQTLGRSRVQNLRGFRKRTNEKCTLPWYAQLGDLGHYKGPSFVQDGLPNATDVAVPDLEWAKPRRVFGAGTLRVASREISDSDWEKAYAARRARAPRAFGRFLLHHRAVYPAPFVLSEVRRLPERTELTFRVERGFKLSCWHRSGHRAPILHATGKLAKLRGGRNVAWCSSVKSYSPRAQFTLFFDAIPRDAELFNMLANRGHRGGVFGGWSFLNVQLIQAR